MSVLSVAKKKLTGKTFGERLRCARDLAGRTQGELAELVGVHRVNLNRYEQDKAIPALDVAWKLADALGVGLEDLRGETYQGE